MSGVSVILCCHSSGKRIPETLRHLARQEVPKDVPWEVLVIDNASTDGTAEVAKREWSASSHAPLRVVPQPLTGLSYAREKGIESARYEFLLFCDDDNWLCPTYLARAQQILEKHPEVALVGGWGKPICEVEPPSWFDDFSGPYGTGPQGDKAGVVSPLMTFYGAGAVVRKSDYLNLSQEGFRFFLSGRQGNKLTTGEDRELGYAFTLNGKKMYYDPELKFQHFIPKERATFKYYRRMIHNCVPAGIVLQAYHLKILNCIGKRAGWKNSYPWIMAMMVLSQIRRVTHVAETYLEKGYVRHLLLEMAMIPRMLWVWSTRGKEFRDARKTIDQSHYVRI
ncbi:MAG: glycosyltransferase [Verrucomicrobia bacterium]|nr:glycosyltransferase [Verrucomicrobiota bacterium]